MGKCAIAAISDAKDMVIHYLDTIVERYVYVREVSTDIYNDYPDGDEYHHLTHVDKAYDLKEAAEILDDLSEFEETDYGLWSGLQPRDAISAQAAYTYGNAVFYYWRDMIDAINKDQTMIDLFDQHEIVTIDAEAGDDEAQEAKRFIVDGMRQQILDIVEAY
jgi:hypothetical protein